MIADQFDAFLFDLDGVIYLEDEPLPDAVESVNRLYETGKQVRFLTNNARRERQAVATQLRELGIDANKDEIVTSGWATAHYLRQREVTAVSVVGSEGLRTELRGEGIEITDDDPEAVVVGADERTSYQDIQRATRHIHRGATFIGTNPDGSIPTPDGPAPGAGAIVRAVEAATGTGPTVVGKPEPPMFEMALDGLTEDVDAIMVGDNPSTDVLGAHRAGLPSILVADDERTAEALRDSHQPDVVISTLAELFTDAANTCE